jgi:class 3 adenylate cyclase
MALLRDYHAAIGEIIIKYSGTLERYAGDGVMVIFNDPVPVENPALQAVQMALEMRGRYWRTDGEVASARPRDRLRHRHSAWLRYIRDHRFRGQIRLRSHWDGFECRIPPVRRGQTGPNTDQPTGFDGG